jgi:hypothetical protein
MKSTSLLKLGPLLYKCLAMRAVAMSQPENLNSSSQLQQIRLQKKTSLLRGKKIIKENSQSEQIRLRKEDISLLCGKIPRFFPFRPAQACLTLFLFHYRLIYITGPFIIFPPPRAC